MYCVWFAICSALRSRQIFLKKSKNERRSCRNIFDETTIQELKGSERKKRTEKNFGLFGRVAMEVGMLVCITARDQRN